MKFTDNDMKELFDLINNSYFNHNFGTVSKSEFELSLFTFYYNKAVINKEGYDDFSLSVSLGITQNRVRAFKEKMALRNNTYNDEWKNRFIILIKNARYDSGKKMFKLHIPEINDLIQLRHFLEINHLYDEYQLNPKLFQCRADVMLELLSELYPEEFKDKELPNIKEIELYAEKENCLSNIDKLKSGKIKEGIIGILNDCKKEAAKELVGMIPIAGSIIKNMMD